ncbi:arginine--tRNA ligase [Emcibacter sp. SYSU 3D8]|uniref:arginine--tRNA ligase n=1 Tax=Emcibacter sp. SYSU 3D8 TaxID=3133969 RepID=UPI0031FEF935
MNIFETFRERIAARIDALAAEGKLPAGLDTSRIATEPPRDASHGDMASNAAMVLARDAGMKPRDLADLIVAGFADDADVTASEIAGPGFINFRVRNELYHSVIEHILENGTSYGDGRAGGGEKVNVEYVSANPTGPMHVGHCRGAVFGDALCSLLDKAGYEVTREYYINDAGAQVDVLARSAFLRYREALGEDIGDIPEGLYPGDYLVPVGQALAKQHGDRWLNQAESEWLPSVRDAAIDAMMAMIRNDLAALGIRFDVFTSERALVEKGQVENVLEDLSSRQLVYTGVLEPPKGKLPDDWEERPQTLFRATEFGDDVDRPLKKSDGSWTYFASDIANHKDKFDRGFRQMIDVWGADHGGYVKRMKAAVTAVTGGAGELDVRLCQLVRLTRNGEPVKMSKRSGSFVTLAEVVDEVGKDVVRFIMLTRKNDAPLDFDFAKVVEQSRDNPVFYVQYAHARICSVYRMAASSMPDLDLAGDALRRADLSALSDEAELALMKVLADWPRAVEAAALAHEPHRIAFYLYDLAASFHSYWNRGNEDPALRFIQADNPSLTTARLALVQAVALTIASGLGVLGVTPAEEMR